METDCTERMCRVRLARNRESNWANEFLARALSCNYTLTCLTILLPLNPAVFQERVYLPTAPIPALFRHTDLMHRDTAPLLGNFTQLPVGFSNFDQYFSYLFFTSSSSSFFLLLLPPLQLPRLPPPRLPPPRLPPHPLLIVLHLDSCLMMSRLMQPIIALTICE